MSNLPKTPPPKTSDREVQSYFDTYFSKPLSFPSNEVDAVVGFFQSRGFEKSASIAVAGVLLKQSKLDNIKVFKILDTMKGLNEAQLSSIVAEILNYNRPKTSSLGVQRQQVTDLVEQRNIVD